MNQITIIGNVGKDPEVKYTPDGLLICNFSVAENEKVKGVPVTTWYKVAAFGKLAEICDKYVVKGKQLYVQGRLKLEEWKDKEGNNKYTLAIIASTIQLLGSKNDGGGQEQEHQQPKPDEKKTAEFPPKTQTTNDDIPF